LFSHEIIVYYPSFAAGYTITPESMTMDMSMFGVMYAPTDFITLMAMANYTFKSMDHRINPGAPAPLFRVVGGDTFRTESDGFGDVKLNAIINLYSENNSKAHFGIGLSLPTGSIDETDNTPRPGTPPTFSNNLLPASMQLGSGTFDLLPSATWLQQLESFSYGIQASSVLRLEEENDNGYRLGNEAEVLAWSAIDATESISVSAGLSYQYAGELKGTQEGIGTRGPAGRSVTTAFGENYGGQNVDIIIGLNYYSPKGPLKGNRLAADLRVPIWQDLNGYQLETDYIITLGWQLAW